MKQIHTGEYPADWKEIARQVKEDAGWECVRCGHQHDPRTGYTLTVHHADCDKSNCRWWNLLPLCQRCHLAIQGKVILSRQWLFEHTLWFKPYVAGYYAHINGLPDDRETVLRNIDHYIAVGQHRAPSHRGLSDESDRG